MSTSTKAPFRDQLLEVLRLTGRYVLKSLRWTYSYLRQRFSQLSPQQQKKTKIALVVLGAVTLLWIAGSVMTGQGNSGTSEKQGAAAQAAPDGMTPGDIARWAEDLEDEYLAQYGYTEFMDAENDMGTAPSAIITFDATTYGELKVYTWAYIEDPDAEAVAEDVASAVAGLPDAPHTVTVSNNSEAPVLATATVND